MNRKDFDLYLIMFTAVILIVLSIAFYFYWDQTRLLIRQALESPFLYFITWAFTVVIFIVHYIKHKQKEVVAEIIITKKFGAFADNFLGGIGYGTAITTALTLMKGLFIQRFFTDKQYFTEFNDLDLMTIFGVAAFLLYVSGVKVIEIVEETFKVRHTQQVLTESHELVGEVQKK